MARRKWLRRGLLTLAAALLGVFLWVRFGCFAEPPALAYEPAVLAAPEPVRDGARNVLGPCWYREEPGLSRLHLEGDPFSRGYAAARLARHRLAGQEQELWDAVHAHLPNAFTRYGVYLLVLFNNRNLPDHVPAEYLEEIYGMSRGGPQTENDYAPLYHRVLNYHAAHDIAHWVWDKPVVGCTAFAAAPAHTRNGHLWVGRNFDFEALRSFDTHKIVVRCRPERGRAFLSVAWPGMAGAVTGINDARIYCSVNGAHSEDRGTIGTPVSFVVRDVLQRAGTLEEAVAIIRDARVFVADTYLVAEGATGRAVVVEKTPRTSAVRAADGGLLVQANHFLTPALKDDPGNLAYLAVGSSTARHARMEEMLRDAAGAVDGAAAARMLRDACAPGGAPLPEGDRRAVHANIATHSVFADVTAGILWVSRGPHALGRYEALSLASFEEPAAAATE